jgi:hypothetical protein
MLFQNALEYVSVVNIVDILQVLFEFGAYTPFETAISYALPHAAVRFKQL